MIVILSSSQTEHGIMTDRGRIVARSGKVDEHDGELGGVVCGVVEETGLRFGFGCSLDLESWCFKDLVARKNLAVGDDASRRSVVYLCARSVSRHQGTMASAP